MYDELEILWKRLGVDDAEIDAFVESNRGTTEETVASVSHLYSETTYLLAEGVTRTILIRFSISGSFQ
jgi:Ase1/PRC1/MAP65 family protein